jgi:alpha-galactosidase
LPFFNIDLSSSKGLILAIGWPGQWEAQFTRDKGGNRVVLRAGQEFTHFKLHPGEEVRSPLIALQFWRENWIHAQNVWRRWMLAHNVPKFGGKALKPMLSFISIGGPDFPLETQSEQRQELYIDRYLAEGIKIDNSWIDAGWYELRGRNWLHATGTWEVDKVRFPNGLRGSNQYAHNRGLKTIVWFEPERVAPDTWLSENHPEWLLGSPNANPPYPTSGWAVTPDQKLLNLGNPDALKWLTNYMDKMITEGAIDVYRQDFAIDPLDFWRNNDSEDRQGITEIRYIQAYLGFWDELLRRHPNMLIDNCASGGRRLDLEGLRRSVPLTRSDDTLTPGDPIRSGQLQTYGISFWIPYQGTIQSEVDEYAFRSAMAPSLNCAWDMQSKDMPYELMRRMTREWRQTADYYLGDYYPLTPQHDTWMAWQFDVPESGEGMVQAFRHVDAPEQSACYKLCGLDRSAKYTITDIDENKPRQVAGDELADKGLEIVIRNKPSAAVIVYKKIK